MNPNRIKRSERLAFRLAYDDYRTLRAVAAAAGITPSAWVRERVLAAVRSNCAGDEE